MSAYPGNFRDLKKPTPGWIAGVVKSYVASASGIFRRASDGGVHKVGYKFRGVYRVPIRVGRERHTFSGLIVAWIIENEEYPLARVVPADGNFQNCERKNLKMEV